MKNAGIFENIVHIDSPIADKFIVVIETGIKVVDGFVQRENRIGIERIEDILIRQNEAIFVFIDEFENLTLVNLVTLPGHIHQKDAGIVVLLHVVGVKAHHVEFFGQNPFVKTRGKKVVGNIGLVEF